MSNATTPTPTPDRSKKSNKKLPLIVDIAIDDNGKQLYQIHESSKYVRKEMPKSTNFTSNEEEKTPIRKLLGTLSPSTLQKKSQAEEVSVKPEANYSLASTLSISSGEGGVLHSADQSSNLKSQYNEIWSAEVEEAFEEILRIIPKHGLNKIKISGRSCGRNELISDYILTKTGKFRTRKQVSSHIQVIKNLGQKVDIIKLINEGPSFNSKEDEEQNSKRFEEIFSKINLDKSLGFTESSKRGSTVSFAVLPKKQKPSKLGMENFYISVNDPNDMNPITLTIQSASTEINELKVKENANISKRFPGLADFQNSKVPIIHNMANVQLPELPYNYTIKEGLKSNYSLKSSNFDTTKSYSVFSCIYSFGNEIMKQSEEIKFNENHPFFPNFLKFFISSIIDKDSSEKSVAFRGITIKQIIFENSSSPNLGSLLVPKSKVKLVLLWEFAQVDAFEDATTATAMLTLPNKITTDDSNILPQSVEFPKRQELFDPDSLSVSPVFFSQLNPSLDGSMPNTNSATTTLESTWDKTTPQSNIQTKFQAFQNQLPIQRQPEMQYSPVTLQQVPLQQQSHQQKQLLQTQQQPPNSHPSVNLDLMMISNDQQETQAQACDLPYNDGFMHGIS